MAKRLINEDSLLIFLRSIKDYVDNNFSGAGNLRDIINNIRKKLLEISKDIENITLIGLNGIEEAPEDDQYYVRINKHWETIPLINDKPTDPDPDDDDNKVSAASSVSNVIPVSGGSASFHISVSAGKDAAYPLRYEITDVEYNEYMDSDYSFDQSSLTVTVGENTRKEMRQFIFYVTLAVYDANDNYLGDAYAALAVNQDGTEQSGDINDWETI